MGGPRFRLRNYQPHMTGESGGNKNARETGGANAAEDLSVQHDMECTA